MEDSGVRTRAQMQRMSAAGDENMAAHARKDAAQPRARRYAGALVCCEDQCPSRPY